MPQHAVESPITHYRNTEWGSWILRFDSGLDADSEDLAGQNNRFVGFDVDLWVHETVCVCVKEIHGKIQEGGEA